MSGTRFWSAPGTLPAPVAPVRPAHKRTKSNYDPSRPVIHIYWPTSRPLQIALVLAAGSVCILIFQLVSTSTARNPGRVQEPGWLKDSLLDALVKCENGLELPHSSENGFVFPSQESPMAHLATKYSTLHTNHLDAPLVLAKRLPQRASLGLSRSCLDQAVAQGSPCPSGSARDPPALDVVWTWTNGSDPLHFRAKSLAEVADPQFIEAPTNPRGSRKAGAEDKLFRYVVMIFHAKRRNATLCFSRT